MNVAFISWDGPDQNYMESLFLPILAEVQNDQLHFCTVQFTWDTDTRSIARTARELGIPYESHNVLRRPLKLATGVMMLKGAVDVLRFARRHDVDALMPRSIIPAAMALIAARLDPSLKLVFDADGLMADERVDFSGWSPEGRTYKVFRDIEARAVRASDAVLTRTERCREILIERSGTDPDKLFVISNGKDTQAFSPVDTDTRNAIRDTYAVPHDAPWVVYAGSLGPQYYPGALFRYFELLLEYEPSARLIVLTGQEDIGRRHLADSNIDPDRVVLTRVRPGEVAGIVAAADVGMALRAATFSQLGVAPIKVGEYLLCGTPVVVTSGVGDLDTQLDETVGCVLDEPGDDELRRAARWFSEHVLPHRDTYRRACRAVGEEHYGLPECVARYRRALAFAKTAGS